MDEKSKYSNPNYVVIPRWRSLIQFWSPILAMVGFLIWGVEKKDLTFDSQRQKYEVIDASESAIKMAGEVSNIKIEMTEVRKNQDQMRRSQYVMEKSQETLERIQVKVGQDSEQIKKMLLEIKKNK